MRGISDPQPIEESHASNETDVVYVGYRQRGRAIVEKRPGQEQLTPERSLEVVNHSPAGFSWGYTGSGPAQLALALLLDYTDDEEVALAEYMSFKTDVVSQLECTGADGCWRLTGREMQPFVGQSTNLSHRPSTNSQRAIHARTHTAVLYERRIDREE